MTGFREALRAHRWMDFCGAVWIPGSSGVGGVRHVVIEAADAGVCALLAKTAPCALSQG